jgi:hypothetical protein
LLTTGEFKPIPDETYQSYVRGADYFDKNKDTATFKIAVIVGDGKDGKCTCASMFISAKHREDTDETAANSKTPLTLYPNPNTGAFSLKATDLPFEKFDLQIYSIVGNLVHQESINCPKGTLDANIAADILADGVYLSVINVGGKPYKTLKFVVHH